MTQPFYITTPIYYVNDVPHLGHAYTTLVAETLAHFHRMRGDDTRMLTGTDEHGQKVEETAAKRGVSPQAHVDEISPRFDETWRALGLTDYRFIRTTSARHKRVVASLWRAIRRNQPDDLYLAAYQGWYCVGCEAFYTESQLVRDGEQWLCETHKRPVSWLDKERSWFFRLSRYAEPLLRHIEAHPEFIRPEAYRNEIVAFLRGGLKDLSVSRTSFTWGIPVPDDDPEGNRHIIYVWMDALTNYYSDLCPEDGALTGPDVERYWPAAIHLIGKDILRFHTVYWPAFLLAAGLPLPRGIFAHGWWTVRGEKISKSMPATRIAPIELADALGEAAPLGRAIGVDAMRYYLLREIPLGNDGDFTFESLFGRFNADLANDLGNLINRSLTLIAKLAAAHPPAELPAHDQPGTPWRALEDDAVTAVRDAAAHWDDLAPSRALEATWRLVAAANRYIDQTKPWELAAGKGALDPAALPHVLWALQAAVWAIGRMIAPVLPTVARELRARLGDAGPVRWPAIREHDGRARVLDGAPALAVSGPTGPLFPRLDEPARAKILTRLVPPEALGYQKVAEGLEAARQSVAAATPEARAEALAKAGEAVAVAKAAAAAPAAAAVKPPIAIDDVGRLDLRVGTVLTAAPVAKAKKLLHLSVDLGEPSPRSIVAGIAEAYAPDQLVGRQVIVVANLAPATIRGVLSQGMILAAGDAQILGLSALDRPVPPGTQVR